MICFVPYMNNNNNRLTTPQKNLAFHDNSTKNKTSYSANDDKTSFQLNSTEINQLYDEFEPNNLSNNLSPISHENEYEKAYLSIMGPESGLKSQSSLQFDKEELDILYNEFENSYEKKPLMLLSRKTPELKLLTNKRNREKEKFLRYKAVFNKNENYKLSVLTYNILNPICMKKMERPDLNFEERMNKIKKEILDLNPDVFCLQEADKIIYAEYLMKEDIKENYAISYGINCGSSFINIIGYKKNKFKLKSFKNFSLLSLGRSAGNRGIMNIELEYINNNKKNNKKTVSKLFTIYNVHLPWKYENDRLLLLKMIFKHIKKNDDNLSTKKIFIMGDFNSEPFSKTIKLFYYNGSKSKFDTKNIGKDKGLKSIAQEMYNKYHFQSAYQYYSKKKVVEGDVKRHPLFTSRTKTFKQTIDYIFFSKNIKIKKILRLPKFYDVEKEKYLPSKEYPSDHVKLYAEFYL